MYLLDVQTRSTEKKLYPRNWFPFYPKYKNWKKKLRTTERQEQKEIRINSQTFISFYLKFTPSQTILRHSASKQKWTPTQSAIMLNYHNEIFPYFSLSIIKLITHETSNVKLFQFIRRRKMRAIKDLNDSLCIFGKISIFKTIHKSSWECYIRLSQFSKNYVKATYNWINSDQELRLMP